MYKLVKFYLGTIIIFGLVALMLYLEKATFRATIFVALALIQAFLLLAEENFNHECMKMWGVLMK